MILWKIKTSLVRGCPIATFDDRTAVHTHFEFNWGSMKILIYFELDAPTPVPQWLLLIHNSKSHSKNAFNILEQYEAVRRFERIHRYDQQKHWIEVYSRSILGATYSLKRHAVSLARGHVMSRVHLQSKSHTSYTGIQDSPHFCRSI